MNTLSVRFEYPAKLSRGILLLKTFLGLLICIPHFICLFFLAIVAGVVALISWFAVLFTGKYPKGLFDYMVGVQDWGLRVAAYLLLLRDEYPAFGFSTDYPVKFNVTYPEKLSRGILLLRTFFGSIYVMVPHGFCLFFRYIAYLVVLFIAWWAILFTGKIPERMFSFLSGTLRWAMNVRAYMFFLTDEYPPFSGKDLRTAPVGSGVPA